MPAHIGLGRPKAPAAPHPSGLPSALLTRERLGQLWRAFAPSEFDEERDQHQAARGERLKRLIRLEAPPDIWNDLRDLLLGLFADAVDKVMERQVEPEYLAALRDVIAEVDKTLALGAIAVERLARKRLAHTEAMIQAQEGIP